MNRLGTDYLDILLLHRPDALCEPEEVAKAFDELESKGKVRYFGVSNHRPSQIELLKTCVRQEIHCNQMRFSIPYSSLVSTGIEANMITEGGADRNGDLLDYCRLHGITVQAWAPFRGKNGSFVDSNETYPDLKKSPRLPTSPSHATSGTGSTPPQVICCPDIIVYIKIKHALPKDGRAFCRRCLLFYLLSVYAVDIGNPNSYIIISSRALLPSSSGSHPRIPSTPSTVKYTASL